MNYWNILYEKLVQKYGKHITVTKILYGYRYFSFITTILLYNFTIPHKQMGSRIFVTLGLIVVCIVMSYLYMNNHENKKHCSILGLVELVENGIFLIISGGFMSPFIWYFISSIFIAAVELSNFHAIIYAIIYFITSCVTTIFILEPSGNPDIVRLYLNTAVSYIIIVTGILQLLYYAVKAEEKSASLHNMNIELDSAKKKLEKTLQYSLKIYETVNLFNLQDKDNILQELMNYMRYLSGVEQVVFVRLAPSNKRGSYLTYGLTKEDTERIVDKAIELADEDVRNVNARYLEYGGKKHSFHFVLYEEIPYGVFVCISDDKWVVQPMNTGNSKCSKEDFVDQDYIIPIFLQIVGSVIKNLESDEMAELLLISEEQNRIANEIHDIVLQKLFAVSCKLYYLYSSEKNFTKNEISEELFAIRKSIDVSMKDLREAIYGFSWDKQGDDTFKNKLLSYAEELRSLYDIKVSIKMEGDTQKIRVNQKLGLYRIICEAINNAIRHGNAKNINVTLIIDTSFTFVDISDDGCGFDCNEVRHRHDSGLGLNNMYRIIEMMNGQIDIKSDVICGTKINIMIPCKYAA